MKRLTTKSTFPYYLWFWTESHENLFELDDDSLAFFQLLTKEAFNG